jgi:hypothetical protein
MSKRAGLRRFYLVLGTITSLWYGYATWTGWELGTDQRDRLSEDARKNPRAARTWYSGFRGGK